MLKGCGDVDLIQKELEREVLGKIKGQKALSHSTQKSRNTQTKITPHLLSHGQERVGNLFAKGELLSALGRQGALWFL